LYGIDCLHDVKIADELKIDKKPLIRKETMKSSVVNEKNKVIESLYDGYGKHNTNKQIGSLRKQKNVFDKFVIPLESPWKANFDNLLILASCINVFTQGFYSAFGNPQDTSSIVLEYLTEVLFSLDLIFCFC
jgi:hypothetical protein